MSWLARSIANSLQIDDHDPPTTSTQSNSQTLTGVQEDLSEFTESLSRQIWTVASFLSPPPPPPSDRINGDDDVSNSNCEVLNSKLDVGMESVGVTDEVLVFATNIAHHPETWLDFPLSEEEEEEEDNDDFEMSDTQWNHTTLVEHHVPRLAALRIELCPVHMSESYFWKVYFVLLHPRLNKRDADLLSTPQIVAARTMWMKELQNQTNPEQEPFESHVLDPHEDSITTSSDSPSANMLERTVNAFEPATYNNNNTVSEEHPDLTKQDGLTKDASDQRVVSSFTIPVEDFGDDDDDWIHENSELDGYDGPAVVVGDEEDISFSDLEDDDCVITHK
ncbi:uncharacterized protein LOC143603142 [Bidens hawaiensis]|uniref:uncharacterized protein LOC143603142 n=1 Tax=Bidens hawaiensis TaxID=980011 RepID=UPI00404A2FA5